MTGAWLWQQQHAVARAFLESFYIPGWPSKPDYRADTLQSLVTIGADPVVLARVAAAEREVPRTP